MDILETIGLDQQALSMFKEIFIVLGIGLLLGLEREYSKQEKEERLFAGVRTFPIVALIGYIALFLSDQYSPFIFVAAFVGVMGIIALAYATSRKADAGTTTEFSLMASFILGSLVFTKNYHLAVTIAVLITTLLSLKIKLHEAVHKLSRRDIFSILYFVVISALVLPLLPDKGMGPYGIFNLYKTWLIVVIFVTLNFLAYFLSKFLSRRHSVLLTGILGGFASSTATAWYFSRQAGKQESGGVIQAAAIILASSIMFPRLLIWLALLNMQMFRALWLPVLVFGAAGLAVGYYLSTREGQGPQEGEGPEISNPINFKEALVFALIYVAIQFVVGYAEEQFGDKGVYFAAAISGLTDVDAITISMANYGKQSIDLSVAGLSVVIGAFSNTSVKYAFCLVFGNNRLRKYASYAFVPLFVMGVGYVLFHLFS
ncbi:MAG: MgtC/SapB family protein [Lewinellaceae bacterium]|nr:MgtC/SapB family protein [Lewinellaceae bacterium]